MESTDDSTLLHRYITDKSDEAFAGLVTRYVNLVYSVALRHVGDPHQAEEIVQAVFIILAKKAAQLRHDKALSSWLFQTTHLTANNFVKCETRRRRHEQEAQMRYISDESGGSVWERIAPLLDSAVAGLNEKDRRAIVLRFYEGRNMREVGVAMSASEEAAKKRVNRALEKLRQFFLKRGVVVPVAALTAAISANSVQAAPTVLAKTATVAALTKGAAASNSTLTLIKGALKTMAWTKAKTAVITGVVIVLAAGSVTTLFVQYQHHKPQTNFPRSSWRNAGYADPVSTFETSLWAGSQGDVQTLIASCSPHMQEETTVKVGRKMQAQGTPPSTEEVFASIGSRYVDGVTGFHVLEQIALSDFQVVLNVQLEGREEKQTIKLVRIGREWKMDDVQ